MESVSGVDLSPVGIASTAALGTPALKITIAPAALASTAALGAPALKLVLGPDAIASTAALGTPSLDLIPDGSDIDLSPVGIASTAALGTPALSLTAAPSALASTLALGVAALALGVAPVGIASTVSVGTPALGIMASVAAIDPTTTVGTPALSISAAPVGVGSTASLGTPALSLTLAPTGIDSTAALGTPAMSVTIAPAGVASTAAVGTPALSLSLHVSSLAPADTIAYYSSPGGEGDSLTAATNAAARAVFGGVAPVATVLCWVRYPEMTGGSVGIVGDDVAGSLLDVSPSFDTVDLWLSSGTDDAYDSIYDGGNPVDGGWHLMGAVLTGTHVYAVLNGLGHGAAYPAGTFDPADLFKALPAYVIADVCQPFIAPRALTAPEIAALVAAGPDVDIQTTIGPVDFTWRDPLVDGAVANAGTGGDCDLVVTGAVTSEPVEPPTLSVVGEPAIDVVLAPAGLASTASVGAPSLSVTIAPASIASGAAIGAAAVSIAIGPGGIDSAATIGTPSLAPTLTPGSVEPTAAIGEASIAIDIGPASIESTALVGVAHVLINYSLPRTRVYGTIDRALVRGATGPIIHGTLDRSTARRS